MDTLKNSAIACLIEAIQPNIVDIGARSGFDESLLSIAWACSVYGFEPEPLEAERLRVQPDCRWRDVSVLPYAIGAFSGKSTLYLPESEAGASLLKHNPDMVEQFGYTNLHIVKKEISVETTTLDELCQSEKLNYIDYIKVDIEGAELDVLKAGKSLLKNCSGLKVECSFLPQRTSQPLIWEVASFMIDEGFDVVNIHDIHRWRRRPLPSHPYIINFDMPYSRGQLAQCDLIFLRRPETITDSRQIIKLIIISAALGYFDFAIHALRTMPAVSEIIQDEYGFKLESELAQWAAMSGKVNLRKAIFTQLRPLIPLLRSFIGLLPYTKPVRPY